MHTMTSPLNPSLNNIKKISWGAIIAGVIIILLNQILFNLLGLSLGLLAFSFDEDRLANLSTGSILWLVFTGIFSTYGGGWAAGKLTNAKEAIIGYLHGITTAGLAIILTFFLMFSTIGGLFTAVTGLSFQLLNYTGQGIMNVGSNISKARPMLIQTIQEINPDLKSSVDNVFQQAQQFFETAINNVKKSKASNGNMNNQINLSKLVQEFRPLIENFLTAQNEDERNTAQQKLVNFLADNTQLNEDEIQQNMNKWLTQYKTFTDQLSEKSEAAKQKAMTATEQTAKAAGKIAFVIFLIFFLNALAGGIGGKLAVTGKTKMTKVQVE